MAIGTPQRPGRAGRAGHQGGRCAGRRLLRHVKGGELRNIYLFLTADALLLGVSDRTGEMAYAGAQPFRHREPEGIGEWIELSLPRLGKPRILNQVVGGLLTLELDRAETWICRFSGTKMREMQRFTRKLEAAIEDKPFPPERESAEAEYCPKCGAPYPDRGRAVCPKCSEKHTVFMRILAYFKGV